MKRDIFFIGFLSVAAAVVCLDICYLIYLFCNIGFFLSGISLVSEGFFAFLIIVIIVNFLLLAFAVAFYIFKAMQGKNNEK